MPDSRSGDPGSKASKRLSVPAGAPEQPLQRIILVTGTPGVGKTELARRLAKEIGSDYLTLSEIVKKERLHKGFDKSTRSYIMDERRVHNRLKYYFTMHADKEIVIDTHSVGSFLPVRRGMIALVLRLDPLVLYKRLRARKWSKRKAWENVEAELIDVSLFEASKLLGRERVYEIDTTGKTRSVVQREALEILSEGRRWHSGRTNWLERYDPVLLYRRI